MTGHKRMVPYGHAVLNEVMKDIPAEYDIFSYTWDDESDTRPNQVHKNLATTKLILDSLETRNKTSIQEPILNKMYDQWVRAGAIPDNPNIFPKKKFSQFLGQILGFLMALETWEKELSEYDYIVRARWDILLDRLSIETMLANGADSNIFLTKGIFLHYGQPQISGDTIYGSRKYWFENFLPVANTLFRLSEKTKSAYQHASNVIDTSSDTNLRAHLFKGKWWSSHALWAMLLCDTGISVSPSGEAYPIGEKLLTIPPKKITIGEIMASGARDS